MKKYVVVYKNKDIRVINNGNLVYKDGVTTLFDAEDEPALNVSNEKAVSAECNYRFGRWDITILNEPGFWYKPEYRQLIDDKLKEIDIPKPKTITKKTMKKVTREDDIDELD